MKFMNINKAIWISYDLGLTGDYIGLYTFLDSVKAKECGNSIAFFEKDYGDDLLASLKTEIETFVTFSKTDRIYVIYLDRNSVKVKGKFLFGGRKRAPWEGYAIQQTQNEEDF